MNSLIIFAKVPKPGAVKTRLTNNSVITPEQACRLYEAFLKDSVAAATMSGADKIAIHYSCDDAEKGLKLMKRLVKRLSLGARNERRFSYTPQVGESFTERVQNALNHEKERGAEEMVIIGADAPAIEPEQLDAAFDFVYSRNGMALGPSGGGGLYLIGYPAATPVSLDTVFTAGSELENMLAIAKRERMALKLLPQTLDVDVEEDLVSLVGLIRALDYQRQFDSRLIPINTHKVIEEMGLTVEQASGDSRDKKIALNPPKEDATVAEPESAQKPPHSPSPA